MPRQAGRWRSWLAVAALVAGACLPVSLAAGEKLPQSARDLRYGVILYNYFQQDFLGALSELQVARERGGIEGHGRHPVVLEGAMSLAFGMDRTATAIFEEALAVEGSGDVQNAAWFYLARMRFRRGDWAGAQASLQRIEGEIDPVMADELRALRIDLAIRTEHLGKARTMLDQRGDAGDWQPYLYYNLGTAHIRAQGLSEGIGYLDQLAEMPLQTAEHWSLQDKGLIAAGFGLLGSGDYAAAVQRFSRVRLESPLAEEALLGYGWSAMQLGDFNQALGPWQILAGRSPLRPAVQEALLAVPHAYEKLGSLGSALQEFEAAERVFSQEIARLEALKHDLRPGDLVAAVTAVETDGPMGQRAPELLSLVELLSDERFARYRLELRDLNALRERLDYWQRNIGVYAGMLERRRLRRQQLLARMHDDDYYSRLEEAASSRDQLVQRLQAAETAEGMWEIADAETRALWERVQRAEATLQRLAAAGEDTSVERQALDRYRGLVLWQARDRWHEWHWEATRALRKLDRVLAHTGDNLQRMAGVIGTVPDIIPYEVRLASLERRLEHQSLAVAQSFQATETALQGMLVEELDRQQDRLRHYQAQARLAKARLYDRAQQEMAL